MFVSDTIVVRLPGRADHLNHRDIANPPPLAFMQGRFARAVAAGIGCALFAASAALAIEVADLTTDHSPAYRAAGVAPMAAPLSLRMASFERALAVH